MKGLLLLFILSPVILLGQLRRAAVVDSINANAADLGAAANLIKNNQRTSIKYIRASDSGEYVDILIRVRVIEPEDIPFITFTAVVTLITQASSAGTMDTLPVPHAPYMRIEIEALPPNAVALLETKATAGGKMGMALVPPAPYLCNIDVPPVSPYAVKQFEYKATTAQKMNTIPVPAMPDFPLDELPQLAAKTFAIASRPATKMDTAQVPVYEPEKKMPVAEMHLSPEGYSLLEKLEGFSPNLYALKDGGLTIGFGFFVPYGEGNKWRNGVTWTEADSIMREKVPQYEDQVKRYINVPLTQNMFDALTMIAYNLGGFAKATSIVNDVNDEADYEQLQKDWMRFVHSKAPGVMKGLMNRRKDELKVRNESDYQPERKIQILKNIK